METSNANVKIINAWVNGEDFPYYKDEIDISENYMNSSVYLKIQDFLTLRHGWCYGEGLSFSRAIADIATQIATRLLSYGFSEMDAFPGLNGEIRVTCYSSEKYFEFTVETVASITFLFEEGDAEKEYQENLTLADCFRKIEKYSQLEFFYPSANNK